MHEESLLNSTTLWYAVAAAIFIVLIVLTVRRPLLMWLDGEIAKVRHDLDEAKRLQAEAQETLRAYRARERDAVGEAEAIIAKARADAERLREEAEAELAATLERHEHLALDRIRLAQEEAMAEVRAYIVDEALTEARGKLKKIAATSDADTLMNTIIDALPHLKAKSV